MEHKNLKNKVLNDLQLIIDLAMEDVKNNSGTTDHLQNFSGKKLAEQKDGLIAKGYGSRWSGNPTLFSIETDSQKIEFPASYSNSLRYAIKNGWGDGTTKQPVKNRRKELEARGNGLQEMIMTYRLACINGSHSYEYNMGIYFGYTKTKTIFREEVIELYEKSKPDDLIRLCWKFITDTKELEGVHYPWINPVVKFEPYGTFELPQKLDWLPEYYKKLKRVA
jgi:hypothetical protein